jgi:hypothetical protein
MADFLFIHAYRCQRVLIISEPFFLAKGLRRVLISELQVSCSGLEGEQGLRTCSIPAESFIISFQICTRFQQGFELTKHDLVYAGCSDCLRRAAIRHEYVLCPVIAF